MDVLISALPQLGVGGFIFGIRLKSSLITRPVLLAHCVVTNKSRLTDQTKAAATHQTGHGQRMLT